MIWVFDCEGDGLDPTKFYCLSACNATSKKINTTSSYDDMRKFLTGAKVLVGHNITRWDIPNLERLLNVRITAKLVDTLALSWYLYPERKKHGLESWGEDFGIPKPVITDWHNLSQEEYEHRCSEDVKINTRLWQNMYRYLLDIYGSDKEIWKLLDYLAFKMKCARLQEESKWKLDIGYAIKSLNELTAIQAEKKIALAKAMPKVPDIVMKSRPVRFLNKKGEYTKLGMDWIALLSTKGLPPSYEGEVEVIKGYTEGNPSSTTQVKAWLDSLGWVPETFKTKKNDETGEIREIPQINLEQGKGICPSIKRLYKKNPELELLDGLSVLQHRIGLLNGFLSNEEDGWLQAQVAGFTNTLRFKHATIVNLPKVDKLFAESIRGALVSPEGMQLCGSDMASLEDRIKQHYIFPHDPDYVHEMNKPDFDPHLTVAMMAGMLTQEQVDKYKAGDKTHKPIRDIAKNGNYACQYGAGVARLMVTCAIDRKEAGILHKAYWDLNWAIKKVASEQRIKTVDNQMWLFNPVSRLWYSLRYEKDIFSTLVQGTASYVFDLWVEEVLSKREQLTAQFHDEIVLCVKEGHSSYNEETKKWEGPIVDFLQNAIKTTNDKLKLNRELGIDVQFGQRYSEIH